MPNSGSNSSLKRLQNRYRLTVINEDTYEEVVKFKLSRYLVFIGLCLAFVLMTCFTAAIIIFTPLKYYLPGVGMGDATQIKEYRELKLRTDSLERSLVQHNQYYTNLQNVLGGKIEPKDTARLNVKKEPEKKSKRRRNR